jgi:hypothetical protein
MTFGIDGVDGTGIMTALIAKQLLALGWIGPARPSHGYWQWTGKR